VGVFVDESFDVRSLAVGLPGGRPPAGPSAASRTRPEEARIAHQPRVLLQPLPPRQERLEEPVGGFLDRAVVVGVRVAARRLIHLRDPLLRQAARSGERSRQTSRDRRQAVGVAPEVHRRRNRLPRIAPRQREHGQPLGHHLARIRHAVHEVAPALVQLVELVPHRPRILMLRRQPQGVVQRALHRVVAGVERPRLRPVARETPGGLQHRLHRGGGLARRGDARVVQRRPAQGEGRFSRIYPAHLERVVRRALGIAGIDQPQWV